MRNILNLEHLKSIRLFTQISNESMEISREKKKKETFKEGKVFHCTINEFRMNDT